MKKWNWIWILVLIYSIIFIPLAITLFRVWWLIILLNKLIDVGRLIYLAHLSFISGCIIVTSLLIFIGIAWLERNEETK